MSELEPLQPPPDKSDEASIREIMDYDGISFDEARRKWEMTKAEVNYKKMQHIESEDTTNG